MKRLLMALSALCLSICLAAAADTPARAGAGAPPPAPAPAAAPGPVAVAVPGNAVPAPDRLCSEINLLDSPEAITAAGFTVDVAADPDSGMPDCPAVFTSCTNSLNVVCRTSSCSTTDTGEHKCRQPDGHVLNCGNKSIHVTSCGGCTKVFEASCCHQMPACLCATCGDGGNQFFDCQ